MAAERGDGVDDEQRAGVVRQLADLFERLPRAGRRLGVHDAPPASACGDRCNAAATSAGSMTRPHGASTFTSVAPQRSTMSAMRVPKTPLTQTTAVVAGLEQVHQARLHAGAAGAGDRDGQLVARLEDELQQPLRLVHDAQEGRDRGGRPAGCSWRASTRGLTVLGPGPSRTRCGGCSGSLCGMANFYKSLRTPRPARPGPPKTTTRSWYTWSAARHTPCKGNCRCVEVTPPNRASSSAWSRSRDPPRCRRTRGDPAG